jgi:hypothetical protein
LQELKRELARPDGGGVRLYAGEELLCAVLGIQQTAKQASARTACRAAFSLPSIFRQVLMARAQSCAQAYASKKLDKEDDERTPRSQGLILTAERMLLVVPQYSLRIRGFLYSPWQSVYSMLCSGELQTR